MGVLLIHRKRIAETPVYIPVYLDLLLYVQKDWTLNSLGL